MTEIEFQAWPKTARLFRDVVITEKLDGTNAAIGILTLDPDDAPRVFPNAVRVDTSDGSYVVYAQSRKRIITPESDNYGFARWVHENAYELVKILGPGLHFGEWWGQGIQRRYDQEHKTFSLFNVDKWGDLDKDLGTARISSVPVLYRGPFSTLRVHVVLRDLAMYGSRAASGFPDPEGVCIFHTASRTVTKATIENDQIGKDSK